MILLYTLKNDFRNPGNIRIEFTKIIQSYITTESIFATKNSLENMKYANYFVLE